MTHENSKTMVIDVETVKGMLAENNRLRDENRELVEAVEEGRMALSGILSSNLDLRWRANNSHALHLLNEVSSKHGKDGV